MFNWLVGHNCLIKQDVCLANAAFHYKREVPWRGICIYPLLYITDKAWLNINRTLLETGLEFSDTIVAHIHNLGFMLPTASSGIVMAFPARLVNSRRLDRGEKMTCVRPSLPGHEWGRLLISFDWNMAPVYITLSGLSICQISALILCPEVSQVQRYNSKPHRQKPLVSTILRTITCILSGCSQLPVRYSLLFPTMNTYSIFFLSSVFISF